MAEFRSKLTRYNGEDFESKEHLTTSTFQVKSTKSNKLLVVKKMGSFSKSDLQQRLDQLSRFAHIESPYVSRVAGYVIEKNSFGEEYALFLLFEWVKGAALDEQLKKGKIFSEEDFKVVAFQLISVLAKMQANYISHYDIHPGNIIYEPTKREAVLIDLGEAKIINESIRCTQSMSPLGAPSYICPLTRRALISWDYDDGEEEEDTHSDMKVRLNPYKSDVFSLGTVFLHMLFGKCKKEFKSLQTKDGYIEYFLEKTQKKYYLTKFTNQILRDMLQFRQELRLDFLQLCQKYFAKKKPKLADFKPKRENAYFEYQGPERNGRPHGYGKLIRKDSFEYEGTFEDGWVVGDGTLKLNERVGLCEINWGEYLDCRRAHPDFCLRICTLLLKNRITKAINFESRELDDKCGIAIANVLKTPSSELRGLNLADNKLGHEAGRLIGEALKTNSKLTELNLWRKWLMFFFLQRGILNLFFVLIDNSIGDEGAISIAEALKSNRTLQRLSLADNGLTSAVGYKFGELLVVNSTLIELDLYGNSLETIGGIRVVKALQMNSTLRSLNLSANKLGDKFGLYLSKVIQNHPSLEELYLYKNQLGPESGIAILRAISKNTKISTLDLAANEIGDETGIEIASMLRKNASLKKLAIFRTGLSARAGTKHGEAIQDNGLGIQTKKQILEICQELQKKSEV